MAKPPQDPLRARLSELLDDVSMQQNNLRDFATVPGNAWLAKGELQNIMATLSELESLLEDIKQADAEAGFSLGSSA